MATTSLWHIKGRLKDLIDYVEDPEKTASKMPELQDLYNVFSCVVPVQAASRLVPFRLGAGQGFSVLSL